MIAMQLAFCSSNHPLPKERKRKKTKRFATDNIKAGW
jgi:hypothetical protein